jgi:hypothetical protein
MQEEVLNAARALLNAVTAQAEGRWTQVDEKLQDPRQK